MIPCGWWSCYSSTRQWTTQQGSTSHTTTEVRFHSDSCGMYGELHGFHHSTPMPMHGGKLAAVILFIFNIFVFILSALYVLDYVCIELTASLLVWVGLFVLIAYGLAIRNQARIMEMTTTVSLLRFAQARMRAWKERTIYSSSPRDASQSLVLLARPSQCKQRTSSLWLVYAHKVNEQNEIVSWKTIKKHLQFTTGLQQQEDTNVRGQGQESLMIEQAYAWLRANHFSKGTNGCLLGDAMEWTWIVPIIDKRSLQLPSRFAFRGLGHVVDPGFRQPFANDSCLHSFVCSISSQGPGNRGHMTPVDWLWFCVRAHVRPFSKCFFILVQCCLHT